MGGPKSNKVNDGADAKAPADAAKANDKKGAGAAKPGKPAAPAGAAAPGGGGLIPGLNHAHLVCMLFDYSLTYQMTLNPFRSHKSRIMHQP